MVISNRAGTPCTRQQLLEAFANLETAGTKVLGVVLTRLPTKGPDAMALSRVWLRATAEPDSPGRAPPALSRPSNSSNPPRQRTSGFGVAPANTDTRKNVMNGVVLSTRPLSRKLRIKK